MKKSTVVLVAVLTALSAMPTMAGLLGSPVSLTYSSTGATTIADAPGTTNPPSVVNGSDEFEVCLGPNSDGCVASGLILSMTFLDNTLLLTGTGSTSDAAGTFTLEFTGLDPVIQDVTYASGGLLDGSIAVTDFTDDSITLSGSTSDFYNAVGGISEEFNINTGGSPVPEPSSAALLLGALPLLAWLRRRRSARK